MPPTLCGHQRSATGGSSDGSRWSELSERPPETIAIQDQPQQGLRTKYQTGSRRDVQ
jgi:hypothetical protein